MSYSIDEKKVIYADLDANEGIVLSLETKDYFRLNETGQIIWQQIAGGKTADEIVKLLLAQYDVSSEQAAADTHEIIEKLQKAHLIQTVSKTLPSVSVKEAQRSKKNNPVRSV